MAHKSEDRLARDTENKIQPRGEDKAGKSWMGIGRIHAPGRWAGIQDGTLIPARTWETQPGNRCRRWHVNEGNNTEAGNRDCSLGLTQLVPLEEGGSLQEWRSGWAGASMQGKQEADASWGVDSEGESNPRYGLDIRKGFR